MFVWVVVSIVAAIGEVLTTGLFLAAVAVAAAITAVATLAFGWELQVLLFAALTLVGIALVRPMLIGMLGLEALSQHAPPAIQNHIIGKRAVVTRTTGREGGQIRIGEGEFWSARAFDPSDVFEEGALVEVMSVEGITALIAPAIPQSALETVTHYKGEVS